MGAHWPIGSRAQIVRLQVRGLSRVRGRRMVAGGMHVHVGIHDDDPHVAVMNGLRPFLPLLLALSTSSPFWQGEDTGLKSYRTAINDATPRSGMTEAFASWGQYQGTIDLLFAQE
jgi:glutamate---cysteine ligase / carboxylate-amine ligase